MSFNPFDEKPAKKIIAKLCKGKSATRLAKLFDKIVTAEMTIDNLHPGGVSPQQGEECLALAEVVATGRGHDNRNFALPDAAADWLEGRPDLNDELAGKAKQAVDKIRSNSGSSAIVEEMGGWPAWTSYCRGLSTRLGKPAKKPKIARQPKGKPELEFLESLEHCFYQKQDGDVVDIVFGDWRGQREIVDADLQRLAGFPKLRDLRIVSQNVTDKGLASLSALKKLESLAIRDWRVNRG